MSATDQIRMQDGRLHETEIFGEAQTRFPFRSNPTPDRHARIHTRKFWIDPLRYVPRLAIRTSYTNLLASSDDFDVAVWTAQSEVTRTANNAANPWDGATATVDRLLETVTNAAHVFAGKAFTYAATAHCLWAIIKPIGGRRYWRLRANDGTSNLDGVFDLTAGQVKSIAGTGVTAGIRKLDDGYFLVWTSFTPLAATGSLALASSTDGSTFSFAGNTSAGCYLAQLQLEQATAPGPLILTAGGSRSVLAPDRDPEDPFAYLVTESDQGEYAGGLSAVQREYARIPRAQLTYPPRQFITKPDYTPPTAFNPYTTNAEARGSATRYTDYASLGLASYAAATGLFTDGDNQVYYPMKTGGARTPGYATAGTFTITRDGHTTSALNWNDSALTIAAALNALTGVSGVFTVSVYGGAGPNPLGALTGGSLQLTLSGGTDADRAVPFVLNVGSLTVSTSQHATTTRLNASTQQLQLVTHVVVTAHGLNTALPLAVSWANPAVFIYATSEWGSVDTDTIWVPNWYNNGVAASLVGNYSSTYSGPINPPYTGGPRLPRRRRLSTFFLPGVSLGIDTPADIAISAGLQNPDDFIAALLVPLTGYQDYEPDGPDPWDQAPPIYVAAMTQVWFQELV